MPAFLHDPRRRGANRRIVSNFDQDRTGLTAAPALADQTDPPSEITVSGNVALTTDYRFRGVSLSGGDPAIQGGITVSHESGFYVGAWSSSIASSPVYGGQELDFVGGWSGEVSPGLTFDAGMTYYP